MSGLLDPIFGPGDSDDQTRPSNMAQEPPKEGPIAPSSSTIATTSAVQNQPDTSTQPTTSPTTTSTQQQQQQPQTTTQPTTSSTTTSSSTPAASPPPQSSSSAPPVASSSAVVTPSSSSSTTTVNNAPTIIDVPSSSTTTTATPIEQSTRTVVVVASGTVSVPGLLSISASRPTGSSIADNSEGKGGVGGSGLPLGAVVGIVIGGLVVIAIIAILATRTVRKRARERRTAHRSSMFEPWPAPVALEDEPYEKPSYADTAQSYPMQDTNTDGYHDGSYPAYGASQAYPAYDQYGQATQPYGQQPYMDAGIAGAAGMGAGAAAVAGVATGPGAEAGLQDNMMVRVKVGFVRSLEDELAITPGQQLYLHTSYDDGWCLCEDQAQNRGVVPVSCLEPWDDNANNGIVPSASEGALTNMSQRRSSLYQVSPIPEYQ
ncbi:hypothetical protein BD324DRAFT_651418 [Kockovaella imperatae]|uniref:SH3 domain-containing protein n=1 Tax=Kockovaella imperatae TaxID=4999 RepID=A0A1Y1UIL2_9TREE|nr:hypothetical protein BD324DRAFT_651418 [Kockovaella imperatae]ORX36945.1 hypothetical protein BD324DRAFT_651418 [Kockovaella imperatae]